MKQFITLLTVCSLALVAGLRAENDNPKKKKNGQQQNSGQATQVAPRQHMGRNANAQGGGQGQHQGLHHQGQAQTQQALGQNGGSNNADLGQKHKNRGPNHHGNAQQQGDGNGDGSLNGANNGKGNKHNNANHANQVNNGNQIDKANKHLAKQQDKNSPEFQAKKQKFQSIHQQHLNFKAQPNQSIASVKFNQNYKIQGAQNWHGPKYVVFQNYHPQWHDQGWWHSHYNDHIFLVGGGWYYWNAGYCYPAWGYSQQEAYYPYDGPIYVGHNPAPPDQIIADVQSSLQEQGYYKGEVDGLLGPLTRAALAEYQQAQGLQETAAMDEPTLESLGMS